MGRRVCIYLPADADELVGEVADLRTARVGIEPVTADLWREALMLGLRKMREAEKRGQRRRR